MILFITLLILVTSAGVLTLWAAWDWMAAQEMEAIDEHQRAMEALGPRGWA